MVLQWEFLFCNFLLGDIVTISDQKGHLLKNKYNLERTLNCYFLLMLFLFH